MNRIWILLLLLCCSLLTACNGGRDPEDRSYIITMGMDWTPDGIVYSFAPAKTTEGGEELVQVTSDTISQAVALADSRSSKEVYLGQLKTVIFGKSMLEQPEAFSQALEQLERGTEISEKVMILGSSGRALDCVAQIAKADRSTGLFVWDFYKNTAQEVGTTRGMDLDAVLTELYEQNQSTIIPRMELEEETLSLAGGIALAEGKYFSVLSPEQEQYHLLLLSEGSGAVILGETNDILFPLEIRQNDTTYHFYKNDIGEVICQIQVNVSGILTAGGEWDLTDVAVRRELETMFADVLETELTNFLVELQKQTSADLIGIFSLLQRKEPTYAESVKNWQDIILEVVVDVTLQDTGRTR